MTPGESHNEWYQFYCSNIYLLKVDHQSFDDTISDFSLFAMFSLSLLFESLIKYMTLFRRALNFIQCYVWYLFVSFSRSPFAQSYIMLCTGSYLLWWFIRSNPCWPVRNATFWLVNNMFRDVLYVFIYVLIVYTFPIGCCCFFSKKVITTSVVWPGMAEIWFAFRFIN